MKDYEICSIYQYLYVLMLGIFHVLIKMPKPFTEVLAYLLFGSWNHKLIETQSLAGII